MKRLILFICIVGWSFNTNAQCDSTLPVSENFNDMNTVYSCWNFIDSDGDGFNWSLVDIGGGDKVLKSRSWIGYALTPDNWAISQQIDLTGINSGDSIKLSWKVRATYWSFDEEIYSVYISSGNRLSDFTGSNTYFTENLGGSDASGQFANRSFDISNFAGQKVYVAFRHHNVTDQKELDIDDFLVSSGTSSGGGDCQASTTSFNGGSLSGANSATLDLGISQGVSFTINGIDQKLKGKNQYIEQVEVSYIDGSGNFKNYGTYSGNNVSSKSININGTVKSVTVTLSDVNGTNSNSMNIGFSTVNYCSSGTGGSTGGCLASTAKINGGTLSGSNSATLNLPNNSQDASFTISGLDEKTKGKPDSQYSEQVVVSYVDELDKTKTFGPFSGANTSSEFIYIAGTVKSIKVTLYDQFGGLGADMSIDLSTVDYCVNSSSAKTANTTEEIQSQSIEENVIVYPNPASESLFVKSDYISESSIEVLLYDLSGMKLRSYNIIGTSNQTNELNINGLPSGLYLLRFVCKDGTLLKTEHVIIK